jgi:hypothetical protein
MMNLAMLNGGNYAGLSTTQITVVICRRRNGFQRLVCTAAILSRSCPLRVKSRHRGTSTQCPLYPRKRTLKLSLEMSALCQKRTFGAGHELRGRFSNDK